jgi:hypothetical protein
MRDNGIILAGKKTLIRFKTQKQEQEISDERFAR